MTCKPTKPTIQEALDRVLAGETDPGEDQDEPDNLANANLPDINSDEQNKATAKGSSDSSGSDSNSDSDDSSSSSSSSDAQPMASDAAVPKGKAKSKSKPKAAPETSKRKKHEAAEPATKPSPAKKSKASASKGRGWYKHRLSKMSVLVLFLVCSAVFELSQPQRVHPDRTDYEAQGEARSPGHQQRRIQDQTRGHPVV